jgi:hypothetical protein
MMGAAPPANQFVCTCITDAYQTKLLEARDYQDGHVQSLIWMVERGSFQDHCGRYGFEPT